MWKAYAFLPLIDESQECCCIESFAPSLCQLLASIWENRKPLTTDFSCLCPQSGLRWNMSLEISWIRVGKVCPRMGETQGPVQTPRQKAKPQCRRERRGEAQSTAAPGTGKKWWEFSESWRHPELTTNLCKGVSRAVTSTGRVAGSYKKPPFRMTITSRFSTIDLAAPFFRMQVASCCFLW